MTAKANVYSGLDIRPCGMLVQKRASDGSKIMFVEDELRRESRVLESIKNAKTVKEKEIAAIRLEVDKLARQVVLMEMEIDGGKKVVERDVLNLIEVLMTQLIKLDGIDADGDLRLQRRMQVKRVQKYIEKLDLLKIRNSSSMALQHQQHKIIITRRSLFQSSRVGSVVVNNPI